MRNSRPSIEAFGAELVARRPHPWRWSYSWWSGYWYGPLPIGMLIGIASGLAAGHLLMMIAR